MKKYIESILIEDSRLPLVIQASNEGTSLSALLDEHRSDFEQKLLEHGALLFRGFDCNSTEDFDRISNAYSPNRIEYHCAPQ